MAASDGLPSSFSVAADAHNGAGDDTDDEFGSFEAAECTSDPYADVYGSTDFSDSVSASSTQEGATTSLMSFSPLMPPATTPPLLMTLSSDTDPFEDITKRLGAAADDGEDKNQDDSGASARSAILDLVWGSSSQEAAQTENVGGERRRSSSASGFVLPPPPSSETTATSVPSTSPIEAATGDLLSFSPVKTMPSDPFFGISNDASGSSSGAVMFGEDDLLSLSAEPPLSVSPSSAPGSLRGSFASLHDANKPPSFPASPATGGSNASPRDPFAERTTRSFGSLSSSFVSVGAVTGAVKDSKFASFGAYSSAATTPINASTSATPSPSSAPASLRNSFTMAGSFMGVTPHTEDTEEADPFEEAGLSFEQVPLADALAAWSTAEQSNAQEDVNTSREGSHIIDGEDTGEEEHPTSPHDFVNSADDGNAEFSFTAAWNEEESIEANDMAEAEVEDGASEVPVAVVESFPPERVSPDSFSGSANPIVSPEDDEVHKLQDDDENGFPAMSEEIARTPEETVETAVHEDTRSFIAPLASPVLSEENTSGTSIKSTIDSPATVSAKSIDGTDEEASQEICGSDDDFGGFGGSKEAPSVQSVIDPPSISAWGSFPAPTAASALPIEDDGDFGDFNAATSTSNNTASNDEFADFAQSDEANDNAEFDDFGDFPQSSAQEEDGFADFQQTDPSAFVEDDDDFGDFTPAASSPVPAPVVSSSIACPALSKDELSAFFSDAFAVDPLPSNPDPQSQSPLDDKPTDIGLDSSTDFVQEVFRNMWDEYISIVAAAGNRSSSSSQSSSTQRNDNGERALGDTTPRASKYLKYVLSEKTQEAARQNGIFTHGSERHQMYVEITASGDGDRMRASLKELQDALFENSVNDAMMRIAKEAALSAKAKIAEQAAQQQANSRGGSLFSTTRHLLSRGGIAHGPSSGNDSKGEHAGADTPTGASVQKSARFPFATSHDDSLNGHRSGDDRGSEGSDHTGHSSGSDSETVGGRMTVDGQMLQVEAA